jgi:hypothetical protein
MKEKKEHDAGERCAGHSIVCPRYPQPLGIGPRVNIISSGRHRMVQNSRETLGGPGRVYPPRLFFCEL